MGGGGGVQCSESITWDLAFRGVRVYGLGCLGFGALGLKCLRAFEQESAY